MRNLLLFILAFLPGLHADEERQLLVAAVGDLPVPRLHAVEEHGFRGYKRDETSSPLVFPGTWSVRHAGGAGEIELRLNQEPRRLSYSAGEVGLELLPQGDGGDSRPLRIAPESANPLVILFNRRPDQPWLEGHDRKLVDCQPQVSSRPTATLLNLSGAILHYRGPDGSGQQLSPGKSATAAIMVSRGADLKLLPLAASAGGRRFTLDVCPIEVSGRLAPVVVVHTAIGAATSKRPFKVTVIQPSRAAGGAATKKD
ncbi:hypothetical protein [Luteolibacter marinus]|uniref:hypothetical protein n=1 Tax=Luteolibacter marinus TaxID=2776705 RepID=UPI0018678284|nr:hypothetical protein [Luteolibacter marinus]